jgi:sugar porter (SP) family MFS transporter
MPLGGIVGSLSASFGARFFGRRNLLLYNNVFFIAGYLLIACSNTQAMFKGGRFITGIACGICSVTVSNYIGETANLKNRGLFGTMMQLSINSGAFISQIIGYFLNFHPGWRIVFGIPAVLAAIQCFLIPTIPRSPPALISKGRIDEARAELQRLRPGCEIENEFEHMLEAQVTIQHEHTEAHHPSHATENPNGKRNLLREVMERPYPKFLFICAIIHMNQMLSGINAVAFYSTTIFTKGFGYETASKLSVGLGAMQVAPVFLAAWAVEKTGRKTVFLSSCIAMLIALILVVVGAQLEIHPLMAAATFLFMASFGFGIGPIPYLLPSELFPSNLLTFASSFVIALNWSCNSIVGFLFPPVKESLGNYTFLLFAGFLSITIVVWVLLFKETKGKTLDQIIKENSGKND